MQRGRSRFCPPASASLSTVIRSIKSFFSFGFSPSCSISLSRVLLPPQRRRDRLASVRAVLRQAEALVQVEVQVAAAAAEGSFEAAIALAVDAQDALGAHAVYDDDAAAAAGVEPDQSVARLKVKLMSR